MCRSDTESLVDELGDSSSDEEDQKTNAIESAVNVFAACDKLGQNIEHFKQEARRYLKGLYELHARGGDSLAILGQSSLNTGAILKDEACTWLNLIHRRLSARQRIRRPWFLEFTRDIPKELYLAHKRALSTTSNHDLKHNIYMDGNHKGFVISLTTLTSILYMFRTLTGKEVREVKGYLTKNIPGKGKAKLLVSGVKDFALV